MEGAGEGVVAIVQALQDAGLTVTLTNPAVGRDRVRRSQAYSGMSNVLKWNGHVSRPMHSQADGFRRCHAHGGGMRNGMNNNYQSPHGSKSTGSPLNRHLDTSPSSFIQHYTDNSFVADRSKDTVTQTPAREALSTRSTAYWSQRAMTSPRPSRGMDAFAESLRKYPCVSPERSTSADIIQRLINYTQSKNLTKSSYHSKSLRSLRNTSEPSNDANISMKKSSKNIQTYTRRESPAKETSPCSQELRLNDRKRSLHSPRSDGVRSKDNGLSATYDYLKGTSRRLSPPKGTEVRYLQDVTKYVRDTLRQICDEQTTTCPKIASRYSQHKRECPKKPVPTIVRPKTCNSCHRPLPSFSKCPSLRKIRFSATEPCPRYIVREVVPKPECPENDPCPCPDPEVEFKKKLKQHVVEWVKDVPVNITLCSLDKKDRANIVLNLVDKLMTLRGLKNCEGRMRKYVLDCLENLPMWLPPGKRPQEVFKNELADDLIYNRLRDLFNMRDKFDEIVAKWVDGLNFDEDGEPVNKGKVVQDVLNRLKPLNQYRTDDNDLFRDDLKKNILDILEKLPLHIEGSCIKYYNEKADNLANLLAGLPKIEFDEDNSYKILINDWLKNVDEAKGLKPSERKRLVEQLSENVKDLITQDMDHHDRKEIIRKVIDDWIGSTRADPGDLISNLRKKILDWLHNKPEFSGDSLSIVQDNEKISKNLANKFKDLLPDILEDDNVQNQLLEDIYDQLKDTLEKRGDLNDLKTTKKLAKDLLNYLVDTVKEPHKDKLEEDLIKIVQDGLKKTTQLAGDTPSSKRDNDDLSKHIAKKFLQVPSKNFDNEDVKDNLTSDINDQLNDALDNRGQNKAPKAMQKLADNIFDKLKNVIQKKKDGDLLENALKKIILESLNEVSELAGVNAATKGDNDKFSKDLASKILKVPPEYIDNEDVKDNLLEDINYQLNEALERRGQRKDPKAIKELAKDMLIKLVDAIKRSKRSKKDSSSSVSDPVENKLRQVVFEYLNDVPGLSVNNPSNKIYNDKVSKVIAKKTKKLLPKLLEDEDVKSQLLEDINDQLKDTLEDRGVNKSPKIINKMANDLLNNLINAVRESQEGNMSNLEKNLIKIVQDELVKTPQLSGDTPSTKRDNDDLSKDIVKKLLKVPFKNLDNEDVKDNLTSDIIDQLNDALDNRGQRKAPKAIRKLANNIFDKLKNAIQKKKEGDLLENALRKIILESLNEVSELAGVNAATKRDNDKFSKDLASKILKVPPEYIDNEDVKDNLLDDINDQLSEALERRGQSIHPKAIQQLANDMLIKLVDAIKGPQSSRKDSSSSVSDPLENKLRHKVFEYLNDVPDLSVYTPSNKVYNDKISKAIAKKTKDLLPKLLEDDDVKNQLFENIYDKLKDTLEDRGVNKSPKIINKMANDLLNNLMNTVKESQEGNMSNLENDLRKIVQDELENTPQLSGDTPSSQRDNDKLSKDIVKKLLQVPFKNLDNEDVKDNLISDINDQLNDALDNRGQRKAPKAMNKLADNIFDKLKNAIQKDKEGDPLEKVLRKKILESLNEVSELAGVNSATNRDNDTFSKDLASKILKVPPEYIDNEDVKDNLLEDINDQLSEALERRGQSIHPKAIKQLAKDMLIKLVDAIKGARSSRKDSSSSVSDPLENKLRRKVFEYLNDVPELSAYTPSDKIYNENISKTIAKKTKDLLPMLLEDDDVKNQLLEDINDQLKDTLEDRGVSKSPKIINKMANDLLNNLVNTVKESQEGNMSNLEKDLIKIVQDELVKTPQLAGDTPSTKRDNDDLSKDIVKKLLQVPSKNLDNENVQDNLTSYINDQLNDALDNRGQRKAPKAMKKLADNLFNKLKNAIQKEKEGDPLENVLRKKILESLNEVSELAGVNSATKRDNDKFSKDLASKILEVPPEYIDNENVKDNLLEDINDQLNKALERRGESIDPKAVKQLAKNMLIKLVDAIKGAQSSRKDSSSSVSDPLENKLRQKISEYLNDVPELSAYIPSNKIYNDKISKAIAKKTKDLLPMLLEDDDVKNQLLEDINDKLKDTLEDRGVNKSPKIINKMANDLLNNIVNTVKESQERNMRDLEKDLIKIVQDELENTPQLSGNTPSSHRDNDKLSKNIVKKLLQVPSTNLDNEDVKDNLTSYINDKLNDALDNRGQRKAPKAMKKLADNIFDKLKNAIQKEKEGDPLENVLIKKILKSLNVVPKLATESFATLRDNDRFSRELAKKMIEVPTEDIDNDEVKDNFLEYINDELDDALKKRRQYKNPEDTKELANNMLNNLVDVIKKGRKNVSAEPTDLRNLIWSWYKDIPELLVADIDESKKSVAKFADDIQKIRDERGSDRQIEDEIDKWIDGISKKKGIKFSKKEKDKLKNKIIGSIKAKSKRSNDEPEEMKRAVWNWFNTIPEIADGDPSANKELADRLADRLVSLKDEGGDTDQKMQDAFDDWLRKTSNKKGVHFSNPQKAKMRSNLMDSLKSALKPSSSLEDDDETKRKVWDWFKEIPKLSEGDNAENKNLVQGLANKLKKYQDDSKDEQYRQKIKDETDDWLEDTSNKKGVILNKKEKEKLIKKLADVFKSMPFQKRQSTSADDDKEPNGPLWDWFRDIPELSGDKLENKLNVDALDKQLKKFGDRIVGTDGAEEIEDVIEDWLEDMADKKNVKIYSKQRKQLRKKLMDALYPNYSPRRTSYSDEDSMQKVWEWFTDIPEITGGDQMKNKKLVRKLDDKLKKVRNQDLEEEHAKHKMQGIIDNWLQDVALIKGERLNTRIKEELRNKLMFSLQTRSLGKRNKKKRQHSSSHDFAEFHNGPQIRDWFNNIPELSNGNQADNKNHVDGLIKHVQKIKNADGDKEQNTLKLKGTIDSWLRGMAKKKGAKLNKRDIESHRNNLMDALKPKRTKIKIRSPSGEKQKVREWFESISILSDGNDVENQKLIDDLAKTIQRIHEKNDGNGKITDDIKDEVDTWINTVSKAKRVRLSHEEVETLKKTLLDSISNKPRKNSQQNSRIPDDKLDERQEVSISDETNSDILDKNTNSESLETDKDTDESSATSNKPKHKPTQKIINKMKAYKSALKGFKHVSTDVDEDRRNISEWLKLVPETQFDDESESSLIDTFSNKLKTLRKEGKVTNKKEMNEEVNNWLEDIYKKKGSKLDNRTKAHLIQKILDSVKSKQSESRKLPSDHSVDDNAQKLKRRASRSPEKTSKTTYNYNDPEAENVLDLEFLKKKINTKTPDGDNEIARSSSSYSKDRKHWNKEPDVRFTDHSINDESPTRSIESPPNKNDTDTIMSENEESASYKSPTLSIKTPELGSPSSASRGSQLDYKSSPTKPTPEKDLRQLIIGAGIEPEIMPESNYQSPNKRKQNLTIKERKKSIGNSLSLSPKRKSSVLKDTTLSDIPLTISETSLRENPRLRARSDVASRKLIEKTVIKPGSKLSRKKSPSKSNRSNATRLYYVEESDSNEPRLRRKSVATQQPIQKSSKRSGEGEDSTRTPMKFNKLTKAKMSDFVAKNIDTITSPNYADVEEDIMVILTEDADLPANEIRALAKMIIKRTRRNNGIEDRSDDNEEEDVTLYEFDSDSEDDSTDKLPRMMSKARHLVKSVFDETYDFEQDPEKQIILEDAIVDLIAEQLAHGDIDDPTRDVLLKLLHDANVPESVADDICEKVMRRARERPMSFSEYQPPRSPRNRIESVLTPNQKLTFLENAQKEITDFYDELTDTINASSRQIINEAIKDTVAKLADILDDPELTGEQKQDMMRNEIIRYLRKLPTESNVPEEDLANQLMDRVQNIKFTSSTPEHPEVEGFNPMRDNLDPSLSTIFDETEFEANENRYKEKLVDAIQKWSSNIDAIEEKVGFKDTMAKDLANEIIDRQKYLQVNPDAKSSGEEELEHSKYIVFKWLNRMVNLNDLTDPKTKIENLVTAFDSISVPKMAEQFKNSASLWALSRASQGNVDYEDPLESDVAGWLQRVPKKFYAKDDPYIQEQQIKQFVDTMKKHKDKPNVEQLAGESINTWLPTMIKADQTVLKTMGNQLKNILEKHGFVNLPQGQQQLPVKSTMASLEKSPQQTEQSQPLLIPPQDYQYIVGNQQNPQIIPTDHVTSKVNDWVSTLPLNVNNPEEQQHLEKMKQNLISQIKQIRQQHPTTSNEYETKLRKPIRFFLQNAPLDPEKNQNDRYLDNKTDELLLNLGLIPMDTDRANPKFKKAVDVLYEVVEKWCKDLPVYSENPNEDPEKTSALKQNISSKIIYKLGELNMNPEILNDDYLYEDLLLEEVDRQLKDVPKNPELNKYLPALKMELAAKVKDARQKIRDELAGQAYKQELRDTISASICLPDNLSPDEQASFEILKDNLADAFINLHYVPDNPEDTKKFKMKINEEINRFCDEFLRRHPRLPVDRRKLTRDLYAALLSVPVPRDESMIHEVEQTRIKDIINDWMKELPLRDETLTEQLHRNKTASLLAKRLHELENEKVSNPDLENEVFEEISKWLRKQQLRPGQEVYIPEFADRLKNKLKSTEHSRRFDLSTRPPHQTQSKLGMICMGRIPPCTLSREDRSHLQRIRERHGSPYTGDDIVCPRVDSFIQGRPRSPCSRDVMVCPHMNSYSQTDVQPKCSDRGSWCRKELCPGKTQTPTQTSGSYCFIRKKRDASCMTPTQSPYEISPHVIVKEYYWDTTDGSKQQNSFQQTQPPPQQRQGSHTPEYQTPQQSYHAPPPPDNQTPRQSFQQQPPQNYVPPGPQYTAPQPSTSSAYQQPFECYQPTNEEIPCIATPSRCNTRYRHYIRSPYVSSGDENYPEPGTSRCRRVKVTRLGSLDDTSCQRNRRPAQKKSKSMICDDDSEWSSVRFPEDGEFWDCPRHRFHGVQGPFIQEKEKMQEKCKCKCKERILTSFRGRNGRSYKEYDARRCNINCPHPSYMYFR